MRGVRVLAGFLVAVVCLLAAGGGPVQPAGAAGSADYVRGDLVHLVDNAARVDWSVDGATIYFDRRGADGYFDTWRMSADGKAQACLTCTHPQLPARHVGDPEMSPDGRYLVLQVEKANHSPVPQYLPEPGSGRFNDLWVLDLLTWNAYQLTDVAPTGVSGVLHPHFNHDGTRLLWSHVEGATAEFDDMALAVADFVTTPSPHLENLVHYNPGPDPAWMETHGWGPNDEYVYFACTPVAGMGDGPMDICRMDFDTPTQVTRLTFTSGENGESAEWDEHAHLTPQFDALAFMSSQPYGATAGDIFESFADLKTELYLANPDGSGQRRMTFFNQTGHPDSEDTQAIVSDLEWNQDGTRILMRVQFPDTAVRDRVFLLDLCANADGDETCDVRESAAPPDAIDVQTDTVLPADDIVVGSVRHLPAQPAPGVTWLPEVHALDLQTLSYHRLTYMNFAIRHMALSPDHRKLAITQIVGDTDGDGVADELDENRVWVVDLVDGKAWRITEPGASAGGGGIDWLDNDWLVFRYKPPGPFLEDIARVHHRTRDLTLLTDTPAVIEADPGASPDRSLVSYAAVDTTAPVGSDAQGLLYKPRIWVMDADGTGQHQVTDGGPVIGRFGGGMAGDFDSEISPDLTKITFGRIVALGTNDQNPADGRPGWGTHRIFSADLSTLAVTELSHNSSAAVIPDWAPDGTIYFTEMAVTAEHQANPYLGLATTTSPAGGLTRIESTVPQQIWKGALVSKVIPPLDTDADTVPDASDNCPAWANPAQATPLWPVPAGDVDCDGFTTINEGQVGTDGALRCAASATANNESGPDRWPVDFNDNRFVNTIDVGFYVSRLGSTAPGPPYGVRYDLVPNGIINTIDVGRFVAFLGKACTT